MGKTYIAIILVFMLSICGCGKSSGSSKQVTPTAQEQAKEIDNKTSKSFMENYMTYVVDMNSNAKRSFYSRNLQQEAASEAEQQEPHPVGYVLGDMESSKEGSNCSARILYEVTGKPDFSIDTYTYTLINVSGAIKIDKISKDSSMELIGEDDKVYFKKDEETEKKQAVALEDLPHYSVMQTGAAPENKFDVPRDKFTSCGMDLDGENIIVTSSDNKGSGCFIAKVSMKDEQQTIQQKDDEGGAGEQGGEQQGDSNKEKSKQQKDSGGNAKPIDLIADCQSYGISFSPEFDKFAVGLAYSDGIKSFRIYDMESEKLEELEIPMLDGKLSASLPCFISNDQIVFNIMPYENATDEEKSYGGKWRLDLKTGELEQIE